MVFAYVADITQEHERSMAYGLVYAVFLYIQILCMLILRSLFHIYAIGRPSPPNQEGIREKTVIKADKAPVLHPASYSHNLDLLLISEFCPYTYCL